MTLLLRRLGGRIVAAIAGALAMAVAVAVPGLALWDDAERASTTFSTASVSPPSSPAVVRDACSGLTASVRATWTGSPTAWVTGYRVSYGLVNGGPYTSSVHVGANDRSAVVPGLALGVSYFVVIEATTASWSSPRSAQVSVTTPPVCL